MRLPVVLLIIALAGVLGGAAIIGLPALGAAIIFDSLFVGVLALRMDDGRPVPGVHEAPSSLLDRVRGAA